MCVCVLAACCARGLHLLCPHRNRGLAGQRYHWRRHPRSTGPQIHLQARQKAYVAWCTADTLERKALRPARGRELGPLAHQLLLGPVFIVHAVLQGLLDRKACRCRHVKFAASRNVEYRYAIGHCDDETSSDDHGNRNRHNLSFLLSCSAQTKRAAFKLAEAVARRACTKSSLLTNIARIADRSVDRREQGFIMQRLPQPGYERILGRL